MKKLLLVLFSSLSLVVFGQKSITDVYVKNDTVLATIYYTPSAYVCGHYTEDVIVLTRKWFVDPYRSYWDGREWFTYTYYEYDSYLNLDRKTYFNKGIVYKVVNIIND